MSCVDVNRRSKANSSFKMKTSLLLGTDTAFGWRKLGPLEDQLQSDLLPSDHHRRCFWRITGTLKYKKKGQGDTNERVHDGMKYGPTSTLKDEIMGLAGKPKVGPCP
jgi:hypothetical protein